MESGWNSWNSWNNSHPSQSGHGQGLSPAGNTNLTLLHTRDEELAKAEVGVLATILVIATLGNVGVLLAMYRLRKKLSRMHLFILHLGLSDLGVALCQVLPQMIWKVTYRFLGPDPLCRAVKYLQVLSMFASTYMLLVLTLDRYLAVCHPLHTLQQPSRQAHVMIGATWLLSSLLSLPQIFIFSLREVRQGSGVLDCWADFRYPWGARAYITWTTLVIFILPVGILTVCYSLICYEICKNLKGKTQSGAPSTGGLPAAVPPAPCPSERSPSGQPSRVSSVRTISRAKIRTVKMTFVIVAAYVTCWAPFFSMQMWSVWDEDAPDDDSTNVAFSITMLLASLSSCCNPWIYMFFSGHLLQDAARCLSCWGSPRLRRPASTGSLCSRKTTILSHSHHSSPAGLPLHGDSAKDLYPPCEEGVTESGTL
ncbi:PREDICTED: vasopressin V1b receptor [Acanthisitta chloris]|uniref:Vasopressin V1b receptor n=1 Tax=Acanthisitta chloris TaxID=57068 RepID=A0A091N235_9PASS|nr:PREDICTED: vasopressin V1b receptor [Acanthisitta chloris]KFP83002.1 Vasopressin V1b receptor [Acanthisitta chloris]